MKDEIGEKIMTTFVGQMRVGKIKNQKDTKKRVVKTKLKFESYKNCLEATQLGNRINYLEKKKSNRDKS